MLVLANISNGLVYQHDNVCNFQSNHGHHKTTGYFHIDAMPYCAVIDLLQGKSITIVDATRRHKLLTDAQKFGVPTWCLVFNRALRLRKVRVCDWQTCDMLEVAHMARHRPLVHRLRTLAAIYGWKSPAIIDTNIHLVCYQNAEFDDNTRRIARRVMALQEPCDG